MESIGTMPVAAFEAQRKTSAVAIGARKSAKNTGALRGAPAAAKIEDAKMAKAKREIVSLPESVAGAYCSCSAYMCPVFLLVFLNTAVTLQHHPSRRGAKRLPVRVFEAVRVPVPQPRQGVSQRFSRQV